MVPSTIGQKLLRIVAAMAIGLISSPLAWIAKDSFLGLGSALVVPQLAIGVWFVLSARDRLRRLWWFGFVVASGLCLPLCAAAERGVHALARFLQELTQQGTISLSQRVIEPAALLLIIVGIPIGVCLLSAIAGRFATRLARSMESAADPELSTRWRFSVRELLIGFAAACLLLAWISGHSRDFGSQESRNQSALLTRFKASFISGETRLLGEPILGENQRSRMARGYSFRPPGVNEYRLVAPIERQGQRLWAVWFYTCNGSNSDPLYHDAIYQFAYAEAASKEELPELPWPPKRYIEVTMDMVDGTPKTAGAAATLVSVTTPARVERPIVLRASAPPGTVCELLVFPTDAVTTPLAPVKVGKNKTAAWTWQVDPRYAGLNLSYQLRCTEQRGAGQMINDTRGGIAIAGPQGK